MRCPHISIIIRRLPKRRIRSHSLAFPNSRRSCRTLCISPNTNKSRGNNDVTHRNNLLPLHRHAISPTLSNPRCPPRRNLHPTHRRLLGRPLHNPSGLFPPRSRIPTRAIPRTNITPQRFLLDPITYELSRIYSTGFRILICDSTGSEKKTTFSALVSRVYDGLDGSLLARHGDSFCEDWCAGLGWGVEFLG